jgi:hypothetical protein
MLDLEDLGSLASLLRVSHPNSSRQALLRVLLNLSAHAPTRRALLRMMMGTVRALTERDVASAGAVGQQDGDAMQVGGTVLLAFGRISLQQKGLGEWSTLDLL